MTARTTLGLCLGALLLLSGAPALAAGGGTLEPFPDLVADCLNADCEVSKSPLSAILGSLYFQLLVGFVVLIPIANAALFKPMLAVLDERDARIAGASAKAAKAAKRADEVFGTYQEAVTVARREAEDIRRATLDGARKSQAEVTAAARADAERQVTTTRRDVASSVEDARSQLSAERDALARTVAEQVLGRTL